MAEGHRTWNWLQHCIQGYCWPGLVNLSLSIMLAKTEDTCAATHVQVSTSTLSPYTQSLVRKAQHWQQISYVVFYARCIGFDRCCVRRAGEHSTREGKFYPVCVFICVLPYLDAERCALIHLKVEYNDMFWVDELSFAENDMYKDYVRFVGEHTLLKLSLTLGPFLAMFSVRSLSSYFCT